MKAERKQEKRQLLKLVKGKTKKEKRMNLLISIITFCGLLFIIFPFLLVLMNSFKTNNEISFNLLKLPAQLHFENYARAAGLMNYGRALRNTFIVTFVGCAELVLFGSMTGYWLTRYRDKLNRFLYLLFIGAMALPFQATMIPFVKVMNNMGLTGNLAGVCLSYLGMCAPVTVVLVSGAVYAIPYDIEESGIIDGCNPLQLFFKIIMPNLKPIISTFTILNLFYIWNDYLLPFILLGVNKTNYTLQIALKKVAGEAGTGTRWDNMLPAIVLCLIPPIIMFLISQKNIIEGMVSGAVKG